MQMKLSISQKVEEIQKLLKEGEEVWLDTATFKKFLRNSCLVKPSNTAVCICLDRNTNVCIEFGTKYAETGELLSFVKVDRIDVLSTHYTPLFRKKASYVVV